MLTNNKLWTYRDVTAFLTENDFSFSPGLTDDAQVWIKFAVNGEPGFIVELPRKHGIYNLRIMNRIIRESGVPEAKWDQWERSNED